MKICQILLVFLMSSVYMAQAFGPNDVVEVVAGLMHAVVKKDNLDELKVCLTGKDILARQFEKTVKNFRQGGVSGITSGIQNMDVIFEELPESLSKCYKISNDIMKVKKFASIFKKPIELSQKLSYNLLFKFAYINADIQEALRQWDKKNYYSFGVNIGEAVMQAVEGAFNDL